TVTVVHPLDAYVSELWIGTQCLGCGERCGISGIRRGDTASRRRRRTPWPIEDCLIGRIRDVKAAGLYHLYREGIGLEGIICQNPNRPVADICSLQREVRKNLALDRDIPLIDSGRPAALWRKVGRGRIDGPFVGPDARVIGSGV